MLKYDVLCIGSATVDNFLIIDKQFSNIKSGDKVLVKSTQKYSGGGATNSAANLARLGLKVKILTKLGNDHNADFIKKELKKYKVKNICLNQSKKRTDFAEIVSSTTDNDRVIYVYKGASLDLTNNDFNLSEIKKAQWIYLGSLMDKSFKTIEEVIKNVKNIKKEKIKLLFNPSQYLAKKGKNKLKTILKVTDILILNKKEAQILLKINKVKNNPIKILLLKLHKLGVKNIIITDGGEKLNAYYNQKFYSLQPPKVKIIDTAGAGDAFSSAMLAGLIKNYDIKDALSFGQASASSIIQHVGTKNKILNEREICSLIKKLKIKVKVKKC